MLVLTGDKDIQITLRHLGLAPPREKPSTPILYSMVDTMWGVVSLRPVRSLLFGRAAEVPQEDDDPW